MSNEIVRRAALVSRLSTVLASERWGLITDVDGTVSPIASSPSEARVDPLCKKHLSRLVGRLPLVAAVSGRPAREASAMIGVEGMVYVGNHGFERWADGELWIHPVALAYRPTIEAVMAQLGDALRGSQEFLVEDKGATASVHYRSAADPSEARRRILSLIASSSLAQGLKVTEGKMVVELRPPARVDKGTAVIDLVERYRLSGAIYLGDDLTDADAFTALRTWQSEGRGVACVLAITGSETPPEVAARADLTLDGIADVRNLLSWLRSRL